MLDKQSRAQTFQSLSRVLSGYKLVRTCASCVTNCDRLAPPNQFCAAASEALPAAERIFRGIAIGSAVPAFHRLNCDPLRDHDPASIERSSEWRLCRME